MARLDLTLGEALDRCNANGCRQIGKGGRCKLHTHLDQSGMPSKASTINRKEYAPGHVHRDKFAIPAVYITQVLECEEGARR